MMGTVQRRITVFGQALARFDEALARPEDSIVRLGLVENDARWMAMVEDRNRTTHAYDEKAAREIYRSLPDYAGMMRGLLERLTERSR